MKSNESLNREFLALKRRLEALGPVIVEVVAPTVTPPLLIS